MIFLGIVTLMVALFQESINVAFVMAYCIAYLSIAYVFYRRITSINCTQRNVLFTVSVILAAVGVIVCICAMEPVIYRASMWIEGIYFLSFLIIGTIISHFNTEVDSYYMLFLTKKLMIHLSILIGSILLIQVNPHLYHYRQLTREVSSIEKDVNRGIQQMNLENIIENDTNGAIKCTTRRIDKDRWEIYYYTSKSKGNKTVLDIIMLEVYTGLKTCYTHPNSNIVEDEEVFEIVLKLNGTIEIIDDDSSKPNAITYNENHLWEVTNLNAMLYLEEVFRDHYKFISLADRRGKYFYETAPAYVINAPVYYRTASLQKSEDLLKLITGSNDWTKWYGEVLLFHDEISFTGTFTTENVIIRHVPSMKYTGGINNEKISIFLLESVNQKEAKKELHTNAYISYEIKYKGNLIKEVPLKIIW